jgi:hypothetical protein
VDESKLAQICDDLSRKEGASIIRFFNLVLDKKLCRGTGSNMNPKTARAAALFLDRTSANPPTSLDLLKRQKQRASLRLSRRRFIGQTAGAAGAVLGASALLPRVAMAGNKDNAEPNPIPYGVNLGGVDFSLVFFGPTTIPGVIGDFNGFVGVAQVQGTGTATYADGSSEALLYDTDMRFMQGVYVGKDGKVHQGTFGFV